MASNLAVADRRVLLKAKVLVRLMPRSPPRLCRFFAKGRCEKGNDCPFRHEGSGEIRTDKNEKSKGPNTKGRPRSPSPPLRDGTVAVLTLCSASERKVHFGPIDSVEYEKQDFGISWKTGKFMKVLRNPTEGAEYEHEQTMANLRPGPIIGRKRLNLI